MSDKSYSVRLPRPGERWVHHKDLLAPYTIMAIAFEERTGDLMVVYRDGDCVWVRPLSEFVELLDLDGDGPIVPRFCYYGEDRR